jgi:hypothetical protein
MADILPSSQPRVSTQINTQRASHIYSPVLNRHIQVLSNDPVTNNGDQIWLRTHSQLLKTWKGQAFVHLWTQAATMYVYRRIYTFLSFPILIFSSISGTIVYATSPWIKYTISALSILTAILASLQRQIRPSERAQEHLAIVQKYTVLIRGINMTLNLPESERPDPSTFIHQIKLELDTLASNQPDPLDFVIQWFNRRFNVSFEKALYGDSLQEIIHKDMMISYAEKETNDRTARAPRDPNSSSPTGAYEHPDVQAQA